jgi:hypothetical protein
MEARVDPPLVDRSGGVLKYDDQRSPQKISASSYLCQEPVPEMGGAEGAAGVGKRLELAADRGGRPIAASVLPRECQ